MKGKSGAVVVADASPLIGLAKIGQVELLRHLFQQILIPSGVAAELRLGSALPGAAALTPANASGWLQIRVVEHVSGALLATVDRGEAKAITLAKSLAARLLIDESRGRVAAICEGVHIFGAGAALIRAKAAGLIPCVADPLRALAPVGYRLSNSLHEEILQQAGE